MEDFRISIKPEGRPSACPDGHQAIHPGRRHHRLRPWPEPMRARFGQGFYLQPYTLDELKAVALRAATQPGLHDRRSGPARIARPVARHAARFLTPFRRCVDAAINAGTDIVDGSLVESTMPLLGWTNLAWRMRTASTGHARSPPIAAVRSGHVRWPPTPAWTLATGGGARHRTGPAADGPDRPHATRPAHHPTGYAQPRNFMGSAPAINWNRVESPMERLPPLSDLKQ